MSRYYLVPRRRSLNAIARDLREHMRTGVPYSCTFIHEIPVEKRDLVEAQLKKAFNLWADSWILPIAEEIEAKAPKRCKKP